MDETTALDDRTPDEAPDEKAPTGATTTPDDLLEETLVDEVSIDGMCGVY